MKLKEQYFKSQFMKDFKKEDIELQKEKLD